MNRIFLILTVTVSFAAAAGAAELFDEETVEFARQVDAEALSTTAVQYKGRVAIFDTPSRDEFGRIYGQAPPADVSPAVAYAELIINAGDYLDKPLIYIKEKEMRGYVSRHLPQAYAAEFDRTNRLRPVLLITASGIERLLNRNRVTTEQIDSADLHRRIGELLPLMGRMGQMGEYRVPQNRLSERIGAFLRADTRIGVISAEGQWSPWADAMAADNEQGELLTSLVEAWRVRDAEKVNSLIDRLRQSQRRLAEAGDMKLPSGTVRRLEYLYNRTYKGSVVFAGFAVSLVIFVLAVGTRRRWPRRAGMFVLGLSTAALLAGIIVRWVLSGRPWYLPPIMNQFESVAGSAALGGLIAFGIELRQRRNYVGLAAAFYATVAMLFCFFVPERMGADISAKHGILNSPIMAVHVSVIIVGHALAGMALVLSLIYVLSALVRRIKGPVAQRSEAADSIDACNLIVARLACWTVIAGTILGAWWADFAWGRWWGWDPKETWALITGVIFVAALHARDASRPRRRAMVTAIGCILAGAAMLFNWVFVNYILTGLHSYS